MDVLHRVVYRQARRDAAAGRVDVEVDWFVGALGFEEEELGDYAGAGDFVDLAIEADDAFFEEAGEDVGGLVAACLSLLVVW